LSNYVCAHIFFSALIFFLNDFTLLKQTNFEYVGSSLSLLYSNMLGGAYLNLESSQRISLFSHKANFVNISLSVIFLHKSAYIWVKTYLSESYMFCIKKKLKHYTQTKNRNKNLISLFFILIHTFFAFVSTETNKILQETKITC